MRGLGDPVGLPGIAVQMLGFLAFVIALVAARRRAGAEERGGSIRSRRSMIGIAVQALGIGIAAYGQQRVTLDPLGTAALTEAVLVALLMGSAVALFTAASSAMGRNWSFVARTRADHRLVEDGPFARVRHPIYVAMALVMLSLAVSLGHVPRLAIAIPFFALGTWLRVTEEERLLRDKFGPAYDAYAARVARFVPGLF